MGAHFWSLKAHKTHIFSYLKGMKLFVFLRSVFYLRQRNGRVGVGVGPWENTFFLGWTISFSARLTVSASTQTTFFPFSSFSRSKLYGSNKLSGGSKHKSLFLHHDSCQFHVGDGSNSYLLYPGVGAGPTRFHEKKSHKTSHHDMTLQVSLEAACITVYLLEHITWSTWCLEN